MSNLQDISGIPGSSKFYASRQSEDCSFDLLSIDRAVGEFEVVGSGIRPSPSPDGNRLAYIEFAPDSKGLCLHQTLVVRELATGEERKWDAYYPAENGRYNTAEITSDLAWSPNNTTLAFGVYTSDLVILDVTANGGSVKDGQWTESATNGLQSPVWTPDQLLVASVSAERTALYEANPETGALGTAVLPDVGRPLGLNADGGVLILNGPPESPRIDLLVDGSTSTLYEGAMDAIS